MRAIQARNATIGLPSTTTITKLGASADTMMTPESPKPDAEAIAAKYRQERNKRLRGDGVSQYRKAEGHLRKFREDVAAPVAKRAAVTCGKRVVIIGAGFGGLIAAVNLLKQGIEDFVIIERGSDFGGTWFWNSYPGK
jgi:cyclohexanone monooxygenase